jgi:hypothetical protein
VVQDVEIRGDDSPATFSNPEEGLDLLRRIVNFMSGTRKEEVLAHTGAKAR